MHQGRVYVFARPPIEPGRSLVGIDAAADGALWTTGMTWHEIARWSDLDRD